MHDHLVRGIAWVSFPCEAIYSWDFIHVGNERKFVLRREGVAPIVLKLDETTAEDIAHMIGQAINHPEMQKSPPAP